MHKILLARLLFFSVLLFVLISCAKEEKIEQPPIHEQQPVQSTISHWRYFHSNDDSSIQVKSVDTVSEIPLVRFRPWTEAVRVTDCGIKHRPAVFLINKCGIYPVDNLKSDTRLPVRHEAFSRASAGNLYTINNDYFIRIYQNSVFLPQSQLANKDFLLRTNAAAIAYTPAADTAVLHLPETAQCKALEYAHGNWYAGFKADSGSDVSFFYLKAKDFAAFTDKKAFEHVEQISAENFKDACEPSSYHQMPQLLKELAEKIGNTAPLYIRVFDEDRPHGTVFIKPDAVTNTASSDEKTAIEAHALYYAREDGKHSAAILLPEGKLALNTSEFGIRMFRLPPLPENFVYTYFFVSGTEITAAWEETVFYEVGRTGLFTAELHDLSPWSY